MHLGSDPRGVPVSEFKASLSCECDRTHSFGAGDSKVECECGSVYVVTITQLRPLTDWTENRA